MKKPISVLAILLLLSACASNQEATVGVATGMLQTRDYIVTMYAGIQGSLYSVRSLDGTVLDEDISLDTMVARYPQLNHLLDTDNIDWADLDRDLLSPGGR